MKKSILLLALIFSFLFEVSSQTWAPLGAKWHYKQSFWWSGGGFFSKTIESIGDTVLLGKSCKVLKITGSEFSPTSGGLKYMYEENDSVFFYQGGEFCLIYDFNTMPGDSFHLPCFSLTEELWVRVLSIDTVVINGVARKRQFVNGGQLGYTVWGANIQGIGNTVYMFPQGDMHYTGPIRCYEDSGGVHHFSSVSCDSTNIVSVKDVVEPFCNLISIYPNPAKQFITIEISPDLFTGQQLSYSLSDIQGRFVKTACISGTTQQIDISELSEGIYFLKVYQGENLLMVVKQLKH